MRRLTLWVGMSLMVVMGFWADRVCAQVLVVPEVHYAPAYPSEGPTSLAARPIPPATDKHLHRAANCVGLGCGMDPYYSQCGNARHELLFIFGSCRYWFRETCPPNHWLEKHGR